MFDSTPDVSHIDQMSEVIRYVHIENKKVEVKESFLGYFHFTGKKAIDITQDILNAVEEDGLDLAMCRGQGYDNASTIAGVHSGVQARIREINPKALLVPCANHSLNLCGVHSFATVSSCVTFFGCMFFSQAQPTDGIFSWQTLKLRSRGLQKPGGVLTMRLLSLCSRASRRLPIPLRNFVTLQKLSTLKEQLKLSYLQEVLVEKAMEFAKGICEEMEIPPAKRRTFRRKKSMTGEKAIHEPLTLEAELKRSMLECIDTFHTEINTRCQGMEEISLRFAILKSKNLLKSSETELPELVGNLVSNYEEMSTEDMLKEIPRLRRFLQAAYVPEKEAVKWSSLRLLQFIVEFELLDSVPNLTLALRFYFTLCVSVASCERSFSKTKLIKTYLRSTMSQARLSSSAILSIENGVARGIDFDEAISQFAESKGEVKERWLLVPKEEHLAVDEQIIPTKAQSTLKQYNPKKPHKVFVLSGVSGV
ncbi:uncharacterized protein LOC123321713 [Coccinella septempunctata]|uniref:uncharacterized protein LOC123321713 n=1 Tax=Coccinella septempunctata TaxID=41139 RepID=UPI001D066778|nr:uncharacterized protein LOC123321713 [Coccinella septempunctata]